MFEFDSDRKRQSVIVKDENTNEIILYCKGADSVIQMRAEKSIPNIKYISE